MTFVVPNDNLNQKECPLAVIKCSDWRFRESDQEFVTKGLGYTDFDLYSWPEAAQGVLRQNGFKKELVEKLVSISRGLHKIKKLLLLWHEDCDTEETIDYAKELQAVKEILAKELPEDLEIIMAYSKANPQGLEYQVIE